jgi:alginate O-acetyltransferase complex protein AlgJ
MKKNIVIFLCLILCNLSYSAPFETLNKNFIRLKSRVMVREIKIPTLANLDYAAYTANPVRFDPQPMYPKTPAKKPTLADCNFNHAISDQCANLSQTPLTDAEKDMPMAWDALQNRLWEAVKTDEFAKIGQKISGEKWADASIYSAYQEIVGVYLHTSGENTELWVKIEFKPWVKFLDNFSDDDNDGFKKLYGKLNCSDVPREVFTKAVDWMRSDYCEKLLTKDQVVDWANVLASYWYPKLNTDIVDLNGQTLWPNKDTENEFKRELKGLVVKDPLVVIRAKPFGKKLYNVFVVDFPPDVQPVQTLQAPTGNSQVPPSTVFDTTKSVNFKNNDLRFNEEIKAFGDYQAWEKKDEPFRSSIMSYVNALPPAQMGFKGKDGWLFFRKEIDYLNGSDLTKQAPDKNPLPHLLEFQKYLAQHNVSLLFVAVPNKSDVYFERLPVSAPRDPATIINPFGRKFLRDLQNSGIEVVDLLPAFLSAKKDNQKSKEALYQKHDTHWTDRGLEIAADLIASRIKHYAWYSEASTTPIRYSMVDTVFTRQGDIVDKMAEADKTLFPPDSLSAKQVHNPDGSLFKGNNPDAPILLIGDSFTGVFELVDCKGAGVGAHIAAETGIPVDIITSWGGGPLVREKMYRARKNSIDKKRVVIYLMVARDLYNYSQLWEPVDFK